MKKKVVILGGGISGLASASFLAQKGYQVQLVEKNDQLGGRCRTFSAKGFEFDMGPSWYWMPDVFERYFEQFGKKVSDYFDLVRLEPSYKVYFKDEEVDIPANYDQLKALLEKWEQGAGPKLDQFLKEAQTKYEISMSDLVFRPSLSVMEFANLKVLKSLFSMDLLKSFEGHSKKFFKHPKILQLLEFPILFLGATSDSTPALYSMMNYADIKLGTWYPMGGMYNIIKAMKSLAEELGVEIVTDSEVHSLETSSKKVKSAKNGTKEFVGDVFVASCDYHHADRVLLKNGSSNYSEKYWDKRKLAPSSLLFYVGVNKKIDGLRHHNLFFDTDFSVHAKEIYDHPQWPSKPLFYVCNPSKTDPDVAPEGSENLFILMPLAPGLEDTEMLRDKYYHMIMERLESRLGTAIRPNVIYKRAYCRKDFESDYHAYKGNAYGLSNVLMQTAILKPRMKHRKLENLYFTGQLTVPGPGMPPSLISGEIVADLIEKEHAL